MRKTVRKIMIAASVAALLFSLLPLSGCFYQLGMYGNNRSSTVYLDSIKTDGGRLYSLCRIESDKYLFVSDGGEASIVGRAEEIDTYGLNFPAVISGNDFPRYRIKCAEGYENLAEMIKERYEKDGVNFVQISAVEYDEGVAYGFCNLFSDSVGYLAGGGNIASEKIVAGVYFKYDKENETYTETEYLDKCNIIACNKESLIYFKNKSYYGHTNGKDDTFVCADEAFDTGFTSYSFAEFFYNADDCMIIMFNGGGNCKKEYYKAVLTTYDGDIKATCTAPCGGSVSIA